MSAGELISLARERHIEVAGVRFSDLSAHGRTSPCPPGSADVALEAIEDD